MQRGRELSPHVGKDAVAELTQMPGSFNGEAKATAEHVLPPEFLEVLEMSGTTENLSSEVEETESNGIFRTKE